MGSNILYFLLIVALLSFDLSEAAKKKKPKHKLGPENVPSNFLVSFTADQKRDVVTDLLIEKQTGTIAQDSTPGNEKLAIRTETRKASDGSLVEREVIVVKRVNGQYMKVFSITNLIKVN